MLTDCVLTQKPFSLFGEGSSYQKTDKQDHSPLALHNPNIMEYAAGNTTCLSEEKTVVTGCFLSVVFVITIYSKCQKTSFYSVLYTHTHQNTSYAIYS